MGKNKMDKSLFSKAKLYWKSPPPGRYMSYKEIMSLSGGGIGIRFIGYCIGPMMLSVGNTLIGNTIGIEPKAMFILYVLGIIASIPLTGLRAYMVDNARSMQGKYRPYLIKMGLPSAILGIAFIWFPYERVSMAVKCVVVLLFNIGFQFFYSFMNDAYDSLLNVLSPNTVERTDVASVKSIVENLSPSIANIFLPIAAKLITGENTLYDIRVYRALYPPMLIVGFVISLVIYLNTEEKIVQARTHAVQISFADAFKAVARNKYFWVLSLAGWIGFLEGSYNNIMGWMYNYRNSCTPGQYSLITTISGNASFWPNIIAPIAIRTVGKKKVLVYTNLMSVGLILLMLPITENSSAPWAIWVLLICNFVNTLVTGLGHQMNPSLNADIRDYQQYITGERIDGMFSTVGLIGSIITLMGSGVLPAIYDRAGLNHATAISLGFDGSNVYDVLYSEAHFSSICSVLVIASAVGAALNVIPYFFYDLTENRQRAMVSVLKIRAFFEDYGNGKLSDRELVDTVDIIREAEEYCKKKAVVLSKSGIRAAKKSGDRDAVKLEKKEYKRARESNNNIEIAQYVIAELNRFNTDFGMRELTLAKKLEAAGLNSAFANGKAAKKEARALPKATPAERDIRRNALVQADKLITAERAVKKYYPNGIKPFDSGIFDELFALQDETDVKYHETIKEMKRLRENGEKEEIARLKNNLTLLNKQKSEIKARLKKATRDNSIFVRAAKPYLDAVKTVKLAESYSNYNEISLLQEQAKARLLSSADKKENVPAE